MVIHRPISLCNALNGRRPGQPCPGNVQRTTIWISRILPTPITASNPFGTGASINRQPVSFQVPPSGFGKYVVSVCIDVYRQGR